MKGFTKTIAAFCAMAMIFGMFSATVFADETDIPQVAAGEDRYSTSCCWRSCRG